MRGEKGVPGGRITPAPAGSTVKFRIGYAVNRDHPRACGEHCRCFRSCTNKWGSPPRLRGAHRSYKFSNGNTRITPAPAGSTGVAGGGSGHFWDHPRACGEHRGDVSLVARFYGSPPRLRGAPALVELSPHPPGITPAPAGSTAPIFARDLPHQDHPRACGEHWRRGWW